MRRGQRTPLLLDASHSRGLNCWSQMIVALSSSCVSLLDVFGPDALGGAYSPVHMPFHEPEYQSRVVEYLIFTHFRKVDACCAEVFLLVLNKMQCLHPSIQ